MFGNTQKIDRERINQMKKRIGEYISITYDGIETLIRKDYETKF